MSINEVLIVDKDHKWQQTVGDVVREAFPKVSRVDCAASGEEALQAAETRRYDLIISAVAYPNKAGEPEECYAVLSHVPTLRKILPDAVVVLVSNNVSLGGIAGNIGVPYVPKSELKAESLFSAVSQ